ncbi:MAG: aspartyl protease family protein [Ignavibacteria bacterium]|nr:aspartyl protease family protein [Ignavibacteria bacterium]
MNISIITVILILFCHKGSTCAQETPKYINATNPKVAIKDGEEGITRYWNHLTKNKFPIVYDLAKNQGERQVTFYTDIDSVSFKVTSNAAYPFNVILDRKDTIAVILSTFTTSNLRIDNTNNSADSIPFSVNKNKQIILKGSINNSAEIDFVFDLGARITFLIGNNLAQKNQLILDGYMEDESSSGLSTEKISSKNTLRFGNIKVENTPICYIEDIGFLKDGGGLIGFNIFQGKILEIDFDKQLLIIHDSLPDKKAGYTPLPFKQTTGGMYVPITINNGAKECVGWFFFDTGADNELTFDSKFALKEKLDITLKEIGSAVIGSNGNRVIKASVLEVPKLTIGNFTLEDVPALLPEESNAEAAIEDGVIGIGLQKRFNMIIDYPNGIMYLKPNKYFNDSFKKKTKRY